MELTEEELYCDVRCDFEVLQLSPRKNDTTFLQQLRTFREHNITHIFFPMNISYTNTVGGDVQTWHHDIGCVYTERTGELIYFDCNGDNDAHLKHARVAINRFVLDYLRHGGLEIVHSTKYVVQDKWQGEDMLCVIDTWFFLYKFCDEYNKCPEKAYEHTASYYSDNKNRSKRKQTLKNFYGQARKVVQTLGSCIKDECKELRHAYHTLQAKHEALAGTHKQFHANYQELYVKHNALNYTYNEKCKELRDNYQTAKNECNELRDKYQRLQAENAALKDKLKNALRADTPPPTKRKCPQPQTPKLSTDLWEKDLDHEPVEYHALVCRRKDCCYQTEGHTCHRL